MHRDPRREQHTKTLLDDQIVDSSALIVRGGREGVRTTVSPTGVRMSQMLLLITGSSPRPATQQAPGSRRDARRPLT